MKLTRSRVRPYSHSADRRATQVVALRSGQFSAESDASAAKEAAEAAAAKAAAAEARVAEADAKVRWCM